MVIDPEAGPGKGYVGRKVPLHPQLVEDGFLEFVRTRPEGYLFADEDGTLHRLAVVGYFGKWIRKLGVGDRRRRRCTASGIAPVAREVGLGREYHEAITGHRAGRTRGDDDLEVPLSALYREIRKLRIVLTRPEALACHAESAVAGAFRHAQPVFLD